MSSRNSERVRASSRKTPSIAEVTQTEFCFSTPRIASSGAVSVIIEAKAAEGGRSPGRPRIPDQNAVSTNSFAFVASKKRSSFLMKGGSFSPLA